MIDEIRAFRSNFLSKLTADKNLRDHSKAIVQKMEERGDYESLPSNKGALVHMAAGAAAGLAEHCAMFPFDSVKTRLQSLCPCPEMKCPSLMQNLASMVKREGWLRPLRGMNAVAWGACPAHAVYFTAYESMKKFLSTSNSGIHNSFVYGVSGIFATVAHDAVMNPAEVVKQRMQMAYSPYGNSLECARCIYRREGFGAFYRSYATQLFMNIPFQIIHFMTYEWMQDLLNKDREYRPLSHLVAGGVAGGLAAAVTTPLDCLKTVLNTQQFPDLLCDNRFLLKGTATFSCRGVKDSMRLIYQLRGASGFFRGLRARVIFQVPSTALSWSAYELFKYLLFSEKDARIGFDS